MEGNETTRKGIHQQEFESVKGCFKDLKRC